MSLDIAARRTKGESRETGASLKHCAVMDLPGKRTEPGDARHLTDLMRTRPLKGKPQVGHAAWHLRYESAHDHLQDPADNGANPTLRYCTSHYRGAMVCRFETGSQALRLAGALQLQMTSSALLVLHLHPCWPYATEHFNSLCAVSVCHYRQSRETSTGAENNLLGAVYNSAGRRNTS
jgi:hypothetical protein